MKCDLCKTGKLATHEDDTGRKLCGTHAEKVESGEWDGTAVDVEKIDNPVVDQHSVTCPFCGGLADERETIDLYEQDEIKREGEAHRECWQEFQDHRCAANFDSDYDRASIVLRDGYITVEGECGVCNRELEEHYDYRCLVDRETMKEVPGS
ncbi:hypothetical protein [Natronococcus jeotgali]|uniref:Uncharacterized protein n=1 Tax=Natronococcus jeotgali DSM 18795 TaxID=1227498 RepID=L9XAS7_9EURY|nr:hypothetical protein [Natronococcus jeotgali]ELY58501.1 hypothetical protein C492_11820 [Natronococcus jeotgali DSM 18795]